MKNGWNHTKLGEACDVIRGSSPRPIKQYITNDAEGVNWVKIGDTKGVDKYIEKTNQRITRKGAERSRKVAPGDLLVSNSMSYGKPYVMAIDGYVHDGWFVLRNFTETFDPDFFYCLLTSDLLQHQFGSLAAGAVVKNISSDLIKRAVLPVPPLPEQRRIVGILDEAFAGIATAKANAEKNLQNARALFESHLNAVFTQRGDGWVDDQLDALTEPDSPITYGVVKPGAEGEIRFVRGGDLVRGKVRLNELRTITRAVSDQYRRTLLRGGELLICLVGQSGQVAVAPAELAGANIARQVGLIRLKKTMNAEFVRYYLQAGPGAEALGSRESGSVQQVINLGELRHVSVPYPKLDEQNEIVEKLDEMASETQRLESIYQRKLAALGELKKSLLHQAFSGQL